MAHEMNFFTEEERRKIEQARSGETEEKIMWSAEGQEERASRKSKRKIWIIVLAVVVIVAAVVAAIVLVGNHSGQKKPELPVSTQEPLPTPTPKPTPVPTPTPRPGPDVKKDDWFAMRTDAELPIPEDYQMTDTMVDGAGYWLDERIAEDYQAMIEAAQADEMQLKIISGYRSENVQQARYEEAVRQLVSGGMEREIAEEEAKKTALPGGCSEHNLGLAADLVARNRQAREVFNETPEYEWLQQHAAEYGFIERYPAGKEAVTGVEAKPWHWRYVGKELAQFLKEEGMTLDEYHSQYLED